MRKIKFRGKTSHSNEWRYGDLVKINGSCHILEPEDMVEDGHHVRQDSDRPTWVEKETVGEFTGMLDKNGKEVYECDIVFVSDFTSVYASDRKGCVTFYNGRWCVKTYNDIFKCYWYPYLWFDDFADRKTEVIGNIHDNPEMFPIYPTETEEIV